MRCAALALLMLCLLAPTAHADGFDTLQGLAKRHLRPAPLVFTTAPAPLSDLGATLALVPGIGKGGYGLRLVHYMPAGPDAGVAPRRGEVAPGQAAPRDLPPGGDTRRGLP